jgi:hypothetical protein
MAREKRRRSEGSGLRNDRHSCTSLYDTQVTDAGLAHLTGLHALLSLNLVGTQVTDVGVAELQVALSNCSIELLDPIPLAPPPPQ